MKSAAHSAKLLDALVDRSELRNAIWKLAGTRLVGAVVCGITLIVMASWQLGLHGITSLLPGLPSMKFNTAFGLCSLGMSMICITMYGQRAQTMRLLNRAATICAALAIIISLLTIAEMVSKTTLGIDEFFCVDDITRKNPEAAYPGRMSPSTATAILLLGITVVLHTYDRIRAAQIACTFTAAIAISIGFVAGVSILISSKGASSFEFFSSMALHTSWCIVLLGTSYLITRNALGDIAGQETLPVSKQEGTWLVVAAMLVFFSGILASGLVSYKTTSREYRAGNVRFDAITERVVYEAKRRIYLPVYGLKGARGMYAGSSFVTRDEFRAYVNSRHLSNEFPGTVGMGFIVPVLSSDLTNYAERQQEISGEPFRITGTGEWDTHFITTYVEPEFRNKALVGYDAGSDPNLRGAIESAIRTGLPTLTPQIEVMHDEFPRAGCMFLVPVYRNGMPISTPRERSEAILGLVYSAIIYKELFAGVISTTEDGLIYSVYEGEHAEVDNLIYSEDLSGNSGGRDKTTSRSTRALFAQSNQITTGGQTWTILTMSTPQFDASVFSAMPTTTTAFGLVFSTLASCFVWVIGRSRARAMELASRTADLRTAASQLRESNMVVNKKNHELALLADRAHRVVDDVSHEFRTPLSVIKEFSSIIADGLAGDVSQQQEEYLKIIDFSVVDLNHMVEDLLDSSKLRAGRLRINRRMHRVTDILKQDHDLIARKASSRSITIKEKIEDGLPTVFVDEEKVRRVISNLMTNAIKFSLEGGEIELSVKRSADSHSVVFAVKDNGPGLSKEDVEQLFGRFKQVSSSRDVSAKGFGLGLSIAHELTWLNLGTISVHSFKGYGATFSFTVPIAKLKSVLYCYERMMARSEEGEGQISIIRVRAVNAQDRTPYTDPTEPMAFLASVSQPTDLILPKHHDVYETDYATWFIIGRSEDPMWALKRLIDSRASIRNENPTDLTELEFDLVGIWEYDGDLEGPFEELKTQLMMEDDYAKQSARH
ncbi:MAG: CHASE domain-containing protein [Phycisphaerales bacterium JB052]